MSAIPHLPVDQVIKSTKLQYSMGDGRQGCSLKQQKNRAINVSSPFLLPDQKRTTESVDGRNIRPIEWGGAQCLKGYIQVMAVSA